MNLSVLGFSGLVEVPNRHPMLTHSLLALFPGALLFLLAASSRKKESYWEADVFRPAAGGLTPFPPAAV